MVLSHLSPVEHVIQNLITSISLVCARGMQRGIMSSWKLFVCAGKLSDALYVMLWQIVWKPDS